MKRFSRILKVMFALAAVTLGVINASGQVGDTAAARHVDQADIDVGKLSPAALFSAGEILFTTAFNRLDGAGDSRRPGFNRMIGPDSQSCFECHQRAGAGALTAAGGSGGNVADILLGNVRNPIAMFGDGGLIRLAEEMSAELQATRAQAVADARRTGMRITRPLTAKGVNFGQIIANANGTVDNSRLAGVDADLIIKPLGWKGTNTSLRNFTTGATEFHLGMQAEESAGTGMDGDGDGVNNELTIGDISALVEWEFLLPPPGRVIPDDPGLADAVARGEALFTSLNCGSCHIPALTVDDSTIRIPNPRDSSKVFVAHLTDAGLPGFEADAAGRAIIRLYGDLKRHDMGRELSEKSPDLSGVPQSVFLTPELWGVASTGPWLHDGRATTLTDAILAHGGEAQASRDAFAKSSPENRNDLIEFLKSLIAR